MRGFLTTYDPFREMERLERHFFSDPLFGSTSNCMPSFGTDITDEGDSYKLTADLPGFEKDDIKIDIEDNTLTLSAERHSEFEKEDKKGKYVRMERSYGSYSRSFDLTGIKSDEIEAKYENGVLTLNLPKLEEVKPASRRLEIK
ncbi:MAG: Hsp20/alpha crystallin family protein [Oscillospiraceae bacterium]|nr:Hsp20/alpha crystallin family protein [Candidatus Limimonas egerieequi]